jgi:hypothetical protein
MHDVTIARATTLATIVNNSTQSGIMQYKKFSVKNNQLGIVANRKEEICSNHIGHKKSLKEGGIKDGKKNHTH